MSIFKTIKTFLWCRAFWASLFFIMLAFNGLLLLTYISGDRNQLIYNPVIKSVLPFYRGAREMANGIIDLTYVFKMRRNVGIPQYRLEIKSGNFRKLNDAIPNSLSDEVIGGTILFPAQMEETVNGTFYFEDKVYDVDVRYRGENSNHWTRAKKSWQIKFEKETPFKGLRTLKLIIPDDRGYYAEAMNFYRAEKFGLAVPETEFVQLYVNNDYQGVYFAIEDFSSEFLEKNNKPADANIYASKNISIGDGGTIYDDSRLWRKESDDKIFEYENFSEIDFLLTQMNREDFASVADDIIDMDSFYNWNIVAILAGSVHQSSWGNMRLYFNNVKGKFEFLPWDIGIKSNPPDDMTNKLVEKILASPEFYKERSRRLWDYVSNPDNLAGDLNYYDVLHKKIKGAFYSDFKKFDNNISFNKKVSEIRSQYESIFNNALDSFKKDSIDLDMSHNSSDKSIDLTFNVSTLAGIVLDGVKLPDGQQITSKLGQYLVNGNTTVNLKYSGGTISDISKIKIDLSNFITGDPVEISSIHFSDISTFFNFGDITQSVDEFVKKHPQFKKFSGNILLPAGNYVFNEDIVVPKNTALQINAGAIISFAKGASLISYSPVQAIGTKERPIRMRALNPKEPWGSFGILNCGDKKSTLEYIDVSGGGSDYINGSFASGMVSVYYSDAILKNSVISGSSSDDGVNFKYSNIEVVGCTFKNNSADGLDLDYDKGIVSNSSFIDNGNDGIDLSGSSVVIRDNLIRGSGDKCISIGEGTKDTVVFNTIMDHCNIGVQSKDGSSPVIINSVIVNNNTGLDAYMKKPIYKIGGILSVYNSILRGNSQNITQDEFSKVDVSFSNVEGGVSGEGNFDENRNYSVINDLGRGSSEKMNKYIGVQESQVPVGIWKNF